MSNGVRNTRTTLDHADDIECSIGMTGASIKLYRCTSAGTTTDRMRCNSEGLVAETEVIAEVVLEPADVMERFSCAAGGCIRTGEAGTALAFFVLLLPTCTSARVMFCCEICSAAGATADRFTGMMLLLVVLTNAGIRGNTGSTIRIAEAALSCVEELSDKFVRSTVIATEGAAITCAVMLKLALVTFGARSVEGVSFGGIRFSCMSLTHSTDFRRVTNR